MHILRSAPSLGAMAGALLLAATPAVADSVTVGSANTDNCYPVSCLASDGASIYQQVYAASAFSGPSVIDSFTLFRGLDYGGAMDDSTYSIAFYTTSRAVGDLSLVLADNLGGLLSNFLVADVSGSMPAELTFDGADFTYDPLDGNLLLQVTLVQTFASGGFTQFFQADDRGLVTSRAYLNANGPGRDAIGVVTRFNLADSGVPEPGAWALMILGFGATGAAIRRRRAALA